MEPSVLWKEEIFGGFKYLPWVIFFFLQGAAKPWTFLALHWRMGGDKFQGQLSFSLPQWVGRCLFCGLIHSKKFKENLCCGASFLSCFGAYLKKLVARVLLYFALFGLCIWFDLEQLSWSCSRLWSQGQKSYPVCCRLLPTRGWGNPPAISVILQVPTPHSTRPDTLPLSPKCHCL